MTGFVPHAEAPNKQHCSVALALNSGIDVHRRHIALVFGYGVVPVTKPEDKAVVQAAAFQRVSSEAGNGMNLSPAPVANRQDTSGTKPPYALAPAGRPVHRNAVSYRYGNRGSHRDRCAPRSACHFPPEPFGNQATSH